MSKRFITVKKGAKSIIEHNVKEIIYDLNHQCVENITCFIYNRMLNLKFVIYGLLFDINDKCTFDIDYHIDTYEIGETKHILTLKIVNDNMEEIPLIEWDE